MPKTTPRVFVISNLLAFAALGFWGCKGLESISVSTGKSGSSSDSGSSGGGGGGGGGSSGNPKILMFVSYHDVWWAEYKVAYEAFKAAGYDVDVRSSHTGSADASYSGNMTSPASFESLFLSNFGAAWNGSWDTNAAIPIDGLIQDVANLDEYVAFVMAGGQGAAYYRYDNAYAALGPGGHQTSAAEVTAAAVKINALVNEALVKGIPVASQCHGASLIPYVRVPGTSGQAGDPGDGLGVSVLRNKRATGFPGPVLPPADNDPMADTATGGIAIDNTDTDTAYASLGILYLYNERVVVDGPDPGDYPGINYGTDLLVTSRDWEPQTVAHMARTVLNMIETYPSQAKRAASVNVLVVGESNPPVNHLQDPADVSLYSDFAAILNADTEFDINATGVACDNATACNSVLTTTNLANYDVLFYFKHNDISTTSEQAIRTFVDNGGGLVGIHHAVYNNPSTTNPTLMAVFGAQLTSWTAGTSYVYPSANVLINVNLGHFVSSYGTVNATSSVHYASSNGLPNENQDGDPNRGYWAFTIASPDELYPGIAFISPTFGRGVNQVNRIIANNYSTTATPGQYDAQGFTKLYDYNSDGTYGKVVYLQPGEREDTTLGNTSYRKAFKNAVIWSAPEP